MGLLCASGPLNGRLVAAETAAWAAPRVVAACDFEGPYNAFVNTNGTNRIHAGWGNGGFGQRDMLYLADTNAGRNGTVQYVGIRGITSGCLQFYWTQPNGMTKGRFCRVSWWMKGDGLEGRIRPQIRGRRHWTIYLCGDYIQPDGIWRRYAFNGLCQQDGPSNDVGVMFECGAIGTFWIDDLLVEDSDEPFPPETAVAPPPPESAGNLLPRTSFEGERDHMWSGSEMGAWSAGVWNGVETDWDDPQMHRAPASVPGKFGKHCWALPAASRPAHVVSQSKVFDVKPGQPYTLSAWMRSDTTNAGNGGAVGFFYWGCGSGHGRPVVVKSVPLGLEWRRLVATGIPQHAPTAADTNAPMHIFLQISPSSSTMTGVTVYVDGLQFEAGTNATDYAPRYPIELYADVGQPGGNLIEWGQRVPLRLLAAAADRAPFARVKVVAAITGFPDTRVHRKTHTLAVDEPLILDFDLRRRGLFRVDLRTLDSGLAAPQEFLFAVVPKPRGTGRQGMFGAHIALRPFLVDYVRRLGFTWTRLHDCSAMTKWVFNEPKRGQVYWHDEVVDGVRQGGLNILGLPDYPPEWAKTTETNGAVRMDFDAFGQYCEAAASHYRGKIDDWEIWNEPYMQNNYGGGQTNFGRAMQTAYAALKRGNPACRVVGWCADIGDPRWGAKLPEEARKCFDVFSFHAYVFNVAGSGTIPFAVELPTHRQLFDTSRVTECWNTEGTYGEVCGNSFYPPARRRYGAARQPRTNVFVRKSG
jgi:hypothetical protein